MNCLENETVKFMGAKQKTDRIRGVSTIRDANGIVASGIATSVVTGMDQVIKHRENEERVITIHFSGEDFVRQIQEATKVRINGREFVPIRKR